MILPEFLTQDPDGFIHLTGHRIGLHHLVRCYIDGYSPEMICGRYPTLSLALVHKVIAFYLENALDVDRYLATCDAEMERQRAAAPRGPDLAELRRRLAAKEAAGA